MTSKQRPTPPAYSALLALVTTVVGVAGLVSGTKVQSLRTLFITLLIASIIILVFSCLLLGLNFYQSLRQLRSSKTVLAGLRRRRIASTNLWRRSIRPGSKAFFKEVQLVGIPGTDGQPSTTTDTPTFRVGVRLSCHMFGAKAPGTSELRNGFLTFLNRRTVTTLVDMISGLRSNPWEPFGINIDEPKGKEKHSAVLRATSSGEPIAYAHLTLPRRRIFVRKRSSSAELIIASKVRSSISGHPVADLSHWQLRLAWALDVPRDFNDFLTEVIMLKTADYPPAEVVVGLVTPKHESLTEVINTKDCTFLPDSAPRSDFWGTVRADHRGEEVWAAARALMDYMCDSALHLHAYESALDKAEDLRDYAPSVDTPKRITRKQFLISIAAGGVVTLTILSAAEGLLGGAAIPPNISEGVGGGKPYLQTTTAPPFELAKATTPYINL